MFCVTGWMELVGVVTDEKEEVGERSDGGRCS